MQAIVLVESADGAPTIYEYPDIKIMFVLSPEAKWLVDDVMNAAATTMPAMICRSQPVGRSTYLTWTPIGYEENPDESYLRGRLAEQSLAFIGALERLTIGAM